MATKKDMDEPIFCFGTDNGPCHFKPFSFEAGEEMDLKVELDFKPDVKSSMPSDWSVVVWGD